MKIIVIIPAYNEGKRVISVLNEVLEVFDGEVVVVDDGSKDDTGDLLQSKFGLEKKVLLVRHFLNLGKGAAMKTGAGLAWKRGAKAIIFLDADGQHNPKFLKDFIKGLKTNGIVFGYREMGTEMPFIRKYGNLFAIGLVKSLFRLRRKDLLCGYMAFSRDAYEKIKWDSSRYGVETEISTKVGKKRLSFLEIKTDTIYIDKYKGTTILDALRILTKIPGWYFQEKK